MPAAASIARLVLAVVFGQAGLAKLRDVEGARTGAADLGIPQSLTLAVARVLPLTELAVAVALLFPPTTRLGAGAAIALLVVLTAALARVIAAGGRPRCHCFGARSSEPAGPEALVRNAALLALGVVALLG